MIPFQSRWQTWSSPSTLATTNTVSDKSDKTLLITKINPSGTFGTATSGQILKDGEELPDTIFDQVRPWNEQAIWDFLLAGKAVPIYSSILNEWIFWIFEENQKQSTFQDKPDRVIYSFRELKILTTNKVTHEGLKILNEAKRILGGRFCE